MINMEDVVDIQLLLNDKYMFYAHTSKEYGKKSETLKEHSDRCLKHFKAIVKARNLHLVFKNFEKLWFNDCERKYVKLFYELIVNTIVFHDIGKINPVFQKTNMKNPLFFKEDGNISLGTEHSIISSIIYLEYFLPKSKDFTKKKMKLFRLLTYVNAYVISKHHGSLDRFEKYIDAFYEDDGDNKYKAEIIRSEYKKYFKSEVGFLDNKSSFRYVRTIIEYETSGIEESVFLYAYEKLIYSLLIASDYYATTEYNNKFAIEFHGAIVDIHKIRNTFNNTVINKSIKKYYNEKYLNPNKDVENTKDINILRSELYLDSNEELLKNLDENIFYLEAPTGSGKSNAAFNLSFQLIEHCSNISKIMYIYPFNTLVEQNLNTVEKTFGHDKEITSNISVINSLTPILKDGDDNYSSKNYEKALLDRQFFNYPITLSTHVTLFDLMFGKSKESGFAFYQLANSVIVLDEIQSYKNTIWTEIITFLKGFAKVLNIKIIIMSATLPNLDLLTNEQDISVKLISNRDKYFLHPLFKDRVNINYELMGKNNIFEELDNRITRFLSSGKKVLVEFITKSSAIEYFKNFTNNAKITEANFKIELMTGDDSNADRSRILAELENSEEGTAFLLISTQVIEAGVDLKNIDIGFKDISKLDSEEQFMGRVNRSCRKEGIVYFFDYDNAKNIYKTDIRINDELTLKSKDMKEILTDKRYDDYYRDVLKMLRTQNESYSSDKNINEFFFHVGKLNIPVISDRMKLIDKDDWSCSVFLNRKTIFVDDENLDGEKVWNDYKKLLENKKDYEYAEWRVKLSIVKSKMNYFIYQVNNKLTFPYTEQLGEIFYIHDADQYFENGKFIREKLENQIGTFI